MSSFDSSSKKSESEPLISKDSKQPSSTSTTAPSKDGAKPDKSVSTSDSDFAKKAAENNWGAPTPTQPRLG
ncbi:hypothetical protein VNI00_015910 [Paramarasmius palmivorus]|uniref:Uncharacterized protein n=1 Tax=Paramarasmius palmivorus TaxID=297713 RepID=A0AAW0BGY8_9AGAR